MNPTTINVPNELRDELAKRAKAEETTMAGAIRHALDESDRQRFWDRVHRENASLTPLERNSYGSGGNTDDLADADDEKLSRHEQW